jgi:hypothetical protein
VRDLISIIVGIAVGFAWLAIWHFVFLHAFGITVLRRKLEDHATRRERMKQLGKLRYILISGVLGVGLSFGLAITAADLVAHYSHGWVFAIVKLVLFSVFFGWFNGARTWSEVFRDPVPFPPNYPPLK